MQRRLTDGAGRARLGRRGLGSLRQGNKKDAGTHTHAHARTRTHTHPGSTHRGRWRVSLWVCVRRPASDARRFRHGARTSPAARLQDFGDCSTIGQGAAQRTRSLIQRWHTMQRNEHTGDDGGAVAAAPAWPGPQWPHRRRRADLKCDECSDTVMIMLTLTLLRMGAKSNSQHGVASCLCTAQCTQEMGTVPTQPANHATRAEPSDGGPGGCRCQCR
jgi:hypothetical protein